MEKSAIRAIIFDFGGVLLDWNPRNLYHRFFDDPAQIDEFLSEIGFSEWNAEQDKGRPFMEGVAELSTIFPKYEPLIRAYWEFWSESIAGPIPGSIALLQRLKRAGFLLYGLSNWSAETFPLACKQYEFFRLFEQIIISGAVKLIKPDPAIFALTLKRIGLPAGNCLLVDDSEPNVEEARKLGFLAIHFRSAAQCEAELEFLGVLEHAPQERKNHGPAGI